MAGEEARIDGLLAAVLRGDSAAWPTDFSVPLGHKRILYHGIAGLIAERSRALVHWPAELFAPVHSQAIAQAMWELRHRAILADLLADFADAGITVLLLKGTAVAYDLYPTPAARARGDTDLLVAPADLYRARLTLDRQGFRRAPLDQVAADDLALQEVWSTAGDDGLRHHIDLHWQLLNAPALRGVLDFEDCAADPVALPRLSPSAMSMNRVLTLLHTCIHRAMHFTAPYFVDGITYYGGDRLIWINDIHLLAQALSDREWKHFCDLARGQGIATVSLESLKATRCLLGTNVPDRVFDELNQAGAEPASTYLLNSQQMGRAWKDLLAIPGWRRKLAYVSARALPSPAFVRDKYPEMASMPISLLYARRMTDLLRERPGRSEGK